MKIGIITFHWATNYGAVLQCYALQTYLQRQKHEVFIINYRPKEYQKTFLKCFSSLKFWLWKMNYKDYKKEKTIEKFRIRYLQQTELYKSFIELKTNVPYFDFYICGSDQIWNPYFTLKGENQKPTSSYFLNFGDINAKRIAFAVSFGTNFYPKDASMYINAFLMNFNAISVREDFGVEILEKMGISSVNTVSDPTLLLNSFDYNKLLTKNKSTNESYYYVYILRKSNNYLLKEIYKDFSDMSLIVSDKNRDDSISGWLDGIKYSSLVLTNSFHGMVFSIIYNIPFVVFIEKGHLAGMNERFYSLLVKLGLENRIVSDYSKEIVNKIISIDIDWDFVNKKRLALQNKAEFFLSKNIVL